MRSACVLAGCLAVIASLAPGQSNPAKATEVVRGEVGKDLDRVMLDVDESAGGFCGVVLVASKGETLLKKGYGVADAAGKKPMPVDALYDWASVTKQFTAAAMLRLIDASRASDSALKELDARKLAELLKKRKWKKLDLDDPLSRFFPEAPADKKSVTLRQLLNHTSGIEAGFKNEWKFDSRSRDSFVACVLSRPMDSKPGEKWDYSNSGYALVAAIIETITGMTFEKFCAEHVFAPAGMKDATMIGAPGLELSRVPKIDRGTGFVDRSASFAFAYGNELNWGYRGCGGVVASTEDMLAWDRALRGKKLLSKDALEDLYLPGLKDYALGWEIKKVSGGMCVEHSGGVLGVATFYLRHLEKDYVVALASSCDLKTHPEEIANRLVRIVEKSQ